MTTAQTTQGLPGETAPTAEPGILAIDIGGTGLKAAILNDGGDMLTERIRVETPHPCKPDQLVDALVGLVLPLSNYKCVSVGFPGVVRGGKIITAPNLGTEDLAGLDLAGALQELLGKPVRVINDADMQGFGAIEGKGLEMVITLGTGVGTVLFLDGRLAPHLELAHHPFHRGKTYEEVLGERARRRHTRRKWNKRLLEAIERLRALTTFDHLYIGGGNARKIEVELPADVTIVDNAAGIIG